MRELKRVALIIGAMKCGTTSLFRYLDYHPQICASRIKEPMFFSGCDWDSGLEAYLELWPDFDADVHQVVMEASTGYSKFPNNPNTAVRIARFAELYGIGFKFIYVVRNPLDLINSGLHHGQDVGWSKGNREKLLVRLINNADFNLQLSKYYEEFDKKDVLVLQFENVVKERNKNLEQIIEFLELDQSVMFPESGDIHNSRKQRAKGKESSDIRTARNWLVGIKPLNIVWACLPSNLKNTARPFIDSISGKIGRAYTEIKKEDWSLTVTEKEKIKNRLKPGIYKFCDEHGIDMKQWDI